MAEESKAPLPQVEFPMGEMPAKPCPFCGAGSCDLFFRIQDGGSAGRVCCNECQTEGPFEVVECEYDGDPSARNVVLAVLEIWNTRTPEIAPGQTPGGALA